MANLSLPRFMKWRAGKPRFEIGGRNREELIRAGFRSQDLKDAAGQWLGLEAAIAAANALNTRIDRWRAGEDLQASGIAALPVAIGGRLTVAHMIAAWQASETYRADAAATNRGRASCLRALSAVFGDIAPAAITRGAALGFHATMLDFAHWRVTTPIGDNAKSRVAPKIGAYLALPKDVRAAVREARFAAMEASEGQPAGAAMAFHACAIARGMWNWCLDNLDGFAVPNPFLKLGLATPGGRVRRITHAEFQILDQAAIDIGMPELGDAFFLGIQTVQRRADLCLMGWDVRRTGRVQLTQQKTGTVIDFRAPAALMARLETIWQRHRAAKFKRMDRLLLNRYGAAYEDPDELTRYLPRLRARAVEIQRKQGLPVTLDDVTLHDTRDTGVIERFEAGLDTARVAEHSGHSLRQLDLIKKSYLGRNRVLADQATDAFDAYQARKGGQG